MSDNKPFHALTRDAAFELLSSTPQGLSNSEAAKRFAEIGPNEIQAAKPVSAWEILLEQFKNVLIVFCSWRLFSRFPGAWRRVHHHRGDCALCRLVGLCAGIPRRACHRGAAPNGSAHGDRPPRWKEVETPARDLVPGDVILLRTGDRIPADVRLLETINLQVEEAALTGESVPVEKHAASAAMIWP